MRSEWNSATAWRRGTVTLGRRMRPSEFEPCCCAAEELLLLLLLLRVSGAEAGGDDAEAGCGASPGFASAAVSVSSFVDAGARVASTSAAVSPANATTLCASAPMRNDDGRAGSSFSTPAVDSVSPSRPGRTSGPDEPFESESGSGSGSVGSSSAAGRPRVVVQRSRTMARGERAERSGGGGMAAMVSGEGREGEVVMKVR